jgi:hypothetical protein
MAELACHRRVATAAVLVNPKETVDLMPEVVPPRPVFRPNSRGLTERIGLRAEGLGQERSAKNCPFGGRSRTRLD